MAAFNRNVTEMYNNMLVSFSQTKMGVYVSLPYSAYHFSSVLIWTQMKAVDSASDSLFLLPTLDLSFA